MFVEPTPKRAARSTKEETKGGNQIVQARRQQQDPQPGAAVFSALANFLQEMQNVAEDEEWDAGIWEYQREDPRAGAAEEDYSEAEEQPEEEPPDWGGDDEYSSYTSDSDESVELSDDEEL